MNRAAFSDFQAAFLALLFASYVGSALCDHVQWHIEIGLLLDTNYHPHPPSTQRTTHEYYEELFYSLSRRLSLLGRGRFVFIWKGPYRLTQAESSVLFRTSARRPTTIDVHRNWLSKSSESIRARTRRNDAVVLLTKRSLTLPSGDEASGFAVKQGMCTKDHLIVVHDDGMFSGENNLVRFLLHSRLTCITSKISKKASHPIPKPPKITRDEFCDVFGAEPCDEEGMGKYEHKRPQKYECYVFCCKRASKILQMAGPDGLKCGEDVFLYSLRKRCLLGRCKSATY
ncbi:uncharacterized protein LOC119374269 isoform X4 [Rhipicephalus sanguineus]|uniref:uncharacterized protein LOC119374269 isoform X4 n=1 Tax=Rhipicephalus sanguineus TaxID=34632 RepID=UPI0020C31B69|nr:uncharacterized protein LOC119374269 isoform X4 [Rhipicephalus sanguineus]